MYLRAASKKMAENEMQEESKFDSMSNILSNDKHYTMIMRMCIAQGDSITKSG
jgi:hypothetical protein